MKRKAKDMLFEEALQGLEAAVKEMERGELPLETALEKFAEGIKFSQICVEKLNDAEQKINIILSEQQGRLVESKLNIEEESSC